MDKADVINKFSEHLFWDIRTGEVDMEKNAPYVVQRVLEYGRLSDWKLLLSYYGLCRIAICELLSHVPCRSYQRFPVSPRTSSDASL